MAQAAPRLYAWIGTVLNGDTTLQTLLGGTGRVHWDRAPQGSPYPRVVIAAVRVGPVKVLGNVTIWDDALFQVVGYDRGNHFGTLEPAMNRVDALLNGKSGSVTNGVILFCHSGEEIARTLPPQPGSQEWEKQLGREWHIMGRSTA